MLDIQIQQNLFRVLFVFERLNKIDGRMQAIFETLKHRVTQIENFKDSNEFNQDVVCALTNLKVRFEAEYFLGFRYCDLYLQDYNMVVELDGDFHYYQNARDVSAPPNAFRNFFILLKNYKLLQINLSTFVLEREKDSIEAFVQNALRRFDGDAVFVRT